MVDHSGSMRQKLADVIAAARDFRPVQQPGRPDVRRQLQREGDLGLPAAIPFTQSSEELAHAISNARHGQDGAVRCDVEGARAVGGRQPRQESADRDQRWRRQRERAHAGRGLEGGRANPTSRSTRSASSIPTIPTRIPACSGDWRGQPEARPSYLASQRRGGGLREHREGHSQSVHAGILVERGQCRGSGYHSIKVMAHGTGKGKLRCEPGRGTGSEEVVEVESASAIGSRGAGVWLLRFRCAGRVEFPAAGTRRIGARAWHGTACD